MTGLDRLHQIAEDVGRTVWLRDLGAALSETADAIEGGTSDHFGYDWDFMRPSDTTYRPDKAEPPAPKVLDADGVEIREGDVLYSIETGDSVTVAIIDPGNPWFATTDGTLQHCAKFTHRAPVIAADGKPLREGETVWDTNGDELIIGALEDGGHTVSCRYADVGDAIPVHGMWSPSNLTHTKPDPTDTYSKLYEDVHDERCSSEEFVLRCRALAERGE